MKSKYIFMMLCSILTLSAVGYASDGEKTTKSELVNSFETVNFDIVVIGSDATGVSQANDVAVLVSHRVITGGLVVELLTEAYSVSDNPEPLLLQSNLYTTDYYEFTNLCADLPDYYREVNPVNYGIRIHNKSLYNSKINKGHTHLYKSDLIRSNCSFRSNTFS